MWWRITRGEFEKEQGEGNRLAMKKIVISGRIPGLIAYHAGIPVGWCSVAPREDFGDLERSRILKPVDTEAVWSLVCFFVAKPFRGRNFSAKLIAGAVKYVKSKAGKIIEAYPTASRKENLAPTTVYMGTAGLFEKAGFREVCRPSKSKVIMRYYV